MEVHDFSSYWYINTSKYLSRAFIQGPPMWLHSGGRLTGNWAQLGAWRGFFSHGPASPGSLGQASSRGKGHVPEGKGQDCIWTLPHGLPRSSTGEGLLEDPTSSTIQDALRDQSGITGWRRGLHYLMGGPVDNCGLKIDLADWRCTNYLWPFPVRGGVWFLSPRIWDVLVMFSDQQKVAEAINSCQDTAPVALLEHFPSPGEEATEK